MSETNKHPFKEVRIGPESETDRGWRYRFTIAWIDESTTEHEVSLSHQDYEFWCSGLERPSQIADRGLRHAASHLGPTLPSRFDLSQMRRRIDDYDQLIAGGD